MPNFKANLSMMFTEIDFLERFGAAAKAGFPGVSAFPYEYPAARIKEQLDKHKLKMVLFNMPPAIGAAGERGWRAIRRKSVNSQRMLQAVEYAQALVAA